MGSISIGNLTTGGSNLTCPRCGNTRIWGNIQVDGGRTTATCGDCGHTHTAPSGTINIGNR